MRISVFGCGYLGAVHAACMASLGHEVVGVDVIEAQVAALAAGEPPFHEPGFPVLLRSRWTPEGWLHHRSSAAREATVHFICVGTPQRHGEGAADLSYVDSAMDSILGVIKPGDLVVGKSTVPVGTAERLSARLKEAEPGAYLAVEPRVPARGARRRRHAAPRSPRLRREPGRAALAHGRRAGRGVRRDARPPRLRGW